MPRHEKINRRLVLETRPVGAPTGGTFRLEETPLPVPQPGEILIRNDFLSIDPYMRGRISTSQSYAKGVDIGQVMVGGTVGTVIESRHPDLRAGDLVNAPGGWQDFAAVDGATARKLDPAIPRPSLALGVLGMPGFTAYMGLLDIGQPKPGETVVVAAASGAVGSVVGQVAKLKGAKAIGIAGGPEKCDFVVRELGFDACLDHHAADFPQQLAAACADGIDVYFENVGGKVFDAVLPLLNVHARVPLCGMISRYNDTELPPGPDRMGLLTRIMLYKRIKMQGFIIFDDYGHRQGEFLAQMSQWVAEGRVKYREDIVGGLENAPQAFIGLLEGRNFGKLVIDLNA